MLAWLRRLATSKPPAPLTGAPEVRRLKTYSAASGFVYQYFYEGHRPSTRDGEPGVEYVFAVSADRASYAAVSVLLADATLDRWQRETARELSSTERYAVAKLVLFRAFDEGPELPRGSQSVVVQAADLAAIAGQLGFL